jgi:hypothetical protein
LGLRVGFFEGFLVHFTVGFLVHLAVGFLVGFLDGFLDHFVGLGVGLKVEMRQMKISLSDCPFGDDLTRVDESLLRFKASIFMNQSHEIIFSSSHVNRGGTKDTVEGEK